MSVKKSYSGLEYLGKDVKDMRKTLGLSRKELAEMVNIGPRYLANIENSGTIPSLLVFYELVRTCQLPVEKYFNTDQQPKAKPEYQKVADKLYQCPEMYLSIVEAAINEAIRKG